MKKIKILTDENRRLLAYCDYGELENSTEIEVEDNFEFSGDIENYILTEENKLKYVFNIEQAKLQKREELKAIRSQKIQADIEVHGEMFQVRDSDKENFDDIKLMLDMGEIDEDYKKHWVLADNSIKEFTAQQIIDVWKERTKRKDKIFLEFGQLSMQLQACKSIDDIEAIVWE